MPLDQPQDLIDKRVDEFRMSFGDHLEDLRRRLILALVGVAVASAGTFYFGREIVAWLLRPLVHVLAIYGLPTQAYVFGVATGFTIFMKVSFIAGLIIAFPWVCYQLWKFVEAGLYSGERRIVLTILPFSALMSLLAVLFLYYVMLPVTLVFMVGFTVSYPVPEVDLDTAGPLDPLTVMMAELGGAAGPTIEQVEPTHAPDAAPVVRLPMLEADPPSPVEGQAWIKLPQRELRVWIGGRVVRYAAAQAQSAMQPLIGVSEYINFVALLALGLILAFQLPVVMLILGASGIIEPAQIAAYRKYALFICFVAGAVLTPTADPFTLLVLAVPLYALFELGLLLMRVAYRQPPYPVED